MPPRPFPKTRSLTSQKNGDGNQSNKWKHVKTGPGKSYIEFVSMVRLSNGLRTANVCLHLLNSIWTGVFANLKKDRAGGGQNGPPPNLSIVKVRWR